MYSYDYIPTYNENQQYLYYQQQRQQQQYQQQQQQQYTTYYHHHQPQQQQQYNINNEYKLSPIIADVKSVWSSALYLPCLYPYLFQPYDHQLQQQPPNPQPIVTSELNELYEYLIKEDNKTPNAIRRLNFNNKNDEDINFNKNTPFSSSLSSDDGYQSGSFDNFVENFNKIQYENLAAVVANKSVGSATLSSNIKSSTEQQHLKDVTNQRNSSSSPKIKFSAPRFEKKWLENQPPIVNSSSGGRQSSPLNKQQQQQKSTSPNNLLYSSNAKKSQQTQSPYKRNNYNNSPPNKYNQQQQKQQINYTKRCNKCSLNFVQCSCSVNGKTILSPSNGTNNSKFNNNRGVSYQLKTRS